MPRGRQPNYDTRIGNLLDQLRDAIIEREKAEMDRRVSEQVRALVSTLDSGTGEFTYRRLERAAKAEKAKAPAKKRRKRKPMSAAQKKAVGERMRRYWAERRKQKEGK